MNDCRAFDAHADTVSCIRRFGFDFLHSRGHLDLARCGEFRGYAQLFALYCRADRAPADGLWAECQRQHDIFQEEMARYPGRVRHCRTAAEVESAWGEGKTAALLSIEGAEMLESGIARLDTAAQWGVRALPTPSPAATRSGRSRDSAPTGGTSCGPWRSGGSWRMSRTSRIPAPGTCCALHGGPSSPATPMPGPSVPIPGT